MTSRLCRLLTLVAITMPSPSPGFAAEECRPRLLVLVYFDQFRGDYLARWSAEFGEGGFKRLINAGAWFQNCHYPYAYTVTAAGHASVAAGCPPADHGVVGNDWYDRVEGKSVNCVGSDRHGQIPVRTIQEPSDDGSSGVSPDRLLKPTIADAIKAGTDGPLALRLERDNQPHAAHRLREIHRSRRS